jgi:signal transduction histidine kinase
LGRLPLLDRCARESAVVGQAREVMRRQMQHIVRVVEDLLDVSRITSGKITLRKEPLEIGGVIAAAVKSTKPIFAARGHALVISPAPDPIWLEADAVRLTQSSPTCSTMRRSSRRGAGGSRCRWNVPKARS